jgi:hypothetical protein
MAVIKRAWMICEVLRVDPLSKGVVLDLRALKGRFVETGVFIGNPSKIVNGSITKV